MGKYASQQALALRLISTKGKVATITRAGVTPADFDPVAQTSQSNPAPASGSFNIVGLPPGQSAQYRIGSLAGRNIEQFYIATLGGSFIPTKGDNVLWAGKLYKLVWTEVYDPADDGACLVVAYGEA